MQTKKESGQSIPTPGAQEKPPRRRVVSWVMAITVLAVITLVTAALLASHAGKPSNTGQQGNTTTPASNRGWTTPAGLAHLNARPTILPSNPRIIFLSGDNPFTIKRSDDGGAHWKTLPVPSLATQTGADAFLVNAHNAENIFVLVTFDLSSSECQANQASNGPINGYSGASCLFPYYSTDSGAHWGLMRCQGCDQAIALFGGYAPVGDIVAQGHHLYSSYYAQDGTIQLITSADGGATWKSADAALLAQGQGLCSFAAVPTATTLYALAQESYCSQPVGYGSQPVGALLSQATHPQAGSALSIWRSNDAGAHWTRVSAFPYQQPDTASFMVIDTGRAQPTFSLGAGQGGSYQRLLSTDGGKTWHPLPLAGIPVNATTFSLVQATLSDGSLLREVQMTLDGPTTFYALKPGSQVWQQVTPSLSASPAEVVVSTAGGHDTLWVTASPSGDFSVGDYSVFYFTLR
jgi:hypothetical protein